MLFPGILSKTPGNVHQKVIQRRGLSVITPHGVIGGFGIRYMSYMVARTIIPAMIMIMIMAIMAMGLMKITTIMIMGIMAMMTTATTVVTIW